MPEPENSADVAIRREARAAWWSAVCLRGDPIRRGDLPFEAFDAGWRAAMAEVRKDREHVEAIERAEGVAWDRRQV